MPKSWGTLILIGYGILLGLVLTWEFLGVAHSTDAWPTITDIITRMFSKHWYTKVLLFLFFAWLVAHFFRRVILGKSGGI